MRGWFRRKPKTEARRKPQTYTIFFTVGGKKYYMIWDAWERADTGEWVKLTQHEMALAFEYWATDQGFRIVGRSDANVAGIRGKAIDEYEVIDNSYFQMDV